MLSDTPLLRSLLSAHRDYVVSETLTLDVEFTSDVEKESHSETVAFSLGEEEVTVGLKKL